MAVSSFTSTNNEGVKPDVAARLANAYGRLGEVREKSEAAFNRFAAEAQVAEVINKPSSSSLRETLARIKSSLQDANSPDAPIVAAVAKPKENTVS